MYGAVVELARTYGAAIWHAPPRTSEAKKIHVKEPAVEQNRCLRTELGAYKATPRAVPKAESGMPSIQIALDRAALRMQAELGAYKATLTAVLKAEFGMASIQIALNRAALRMQALWNSHPLTKIDNTQIRKTAGRRPAM